MSLRVQPVRPLLFGGLVLLIATSGALGVPVSHHAHAVVDVPPKPHRSPFDVLSRLDRVRRTFASPSQTLAPLAIDGRDDSAWVGGETGGPWSWRVDFRDPVHLGAVRAVFGDGPTRGVPSTYAWEVVRATDAGVACPDPSDDDTFAAVEGATDTAAPKVIALPSRRSWFMNEDVCSLRLTVMRTNGGAPVVREIEAIEAARNVLARATASSADSDPASDPHAAMDGKYASRWVGAAAKKEWTLAVTLAEPTPVDRVRIVLGFDAVGRPREPNRVGRTYGVSYAPVHYRLEGTEDLEHYFLLGSEPLRRDGTPLWVRRRLVKMGHPRVLRGLRLVMEGATDGNGVPSSSSAPVIRELEAYRSDDPRHVISPPWLMSVNANPAGVSHGIGGGELANDVYFAKFLHVRFSSFVGGMRRDDRYSRALGAKGELLPAPPGDNDGEFLESIEGDDPAFEAELLAENSPPPIAVLSGSNDWDYAPVTGPDAKSPKQWHWDPLKDAPGGGMAQLAPLLKQRSVPLLGICGGAQIMALLEAKEELSEDDSQIIDAVLRRTTGEPIRGFAPASADEVSWPGDPRGNAQIEFRPTDRLFWDLSGALGRTATRSMPLHHVDVIRPDAFLKDGPLHRFDVIATSAFCSARVVSGGDNDMAFPNPDGSGQCIIVPQAFRAIGEGYPAVGVQFHPEQRKFPSAVRGDPPEATEDPLLFVAAMYDEVVGEWLRRAP